MPGRKRTRIEELFDELVVLSTAERAARLADPRLSPDIRGRLQGLLRSDSEAGADFLSPRGLDSPHDLEDIGTAIGAYRVLRRVGEGGFGDVYLAEQEGPLHRRVAVKVLKPGMDSRAVVSRFESERSTLALLDHPHIASVHDAGTTSTGRPYFVMEYVEGLCLTKFAADRGLDVPARLELFLQVCDAVQHAHQRGVVHRDLKPSNVLVHEVDGSAQVKVIDFGIAKALEATLERATILTAGGQLVGTPEYMSPEQARMDGRIDTRTDIYQLGALLYELLTGLRPFDFSTPGSRFLPVMLETIIECQPPRPSARIRTAGERGAREYETALDRNLQIDLDWITLKALEKEPDRRYASVSALATDIRHALRHEPVLATPPSAAYRLAKFVRRNRVLVGSAASLLVALMLATAFSTWQYVVKSRALTAKVAAMKRLQGARLTAESSLVLADDPRLALLLAVEGAERAPGSPADLALVSSLEAVLAETVRGTVLPRLEGHSDELWWAGFSPDAQRVVTASRDGSVRLWKAETGVELHRFEAPDREWVRQPVFSKDGSRLATTGDRVVRIWETDSGAQLTRLVGHRQYVTTVCFSPDDARVLTASLDRTARIWDADTGEELLELDGHSANVIAADFSPDGRRVVTASHDHTAAIWDAHSGERLHRLEGHDGRLLSTCFGPLGRRVLTVGWRGKAWLWDASSGEQVHVLRAGSDEIRSAVFDPEGRRVAAGSGFSAFVWDVASGERILELSGHRGKVRSVSFDAGGRFILSGSDDGTARIWDAISGADLGGFGKHAGRVQCARFSPDGRRLVTASFDGSARIWLVDLLSTAKKFRPRLLRPEEMARYELLPPESLEEYRKSWAPRRPRNLSAKPRAVRGRPGVVLEASPFEHDLEGARHKETRWQLRSADSDYAKTPTIDFISREHLLEFPVEEGVLLPGTTYYWRVQYLASNGSSSSFSAETGLTPPDRGLEAVPIPLEAHFNRDVIVDPGDRINDSLGGTANHQFVVDGYDGTTEGDPNVSGLPVDRKLGIHRLGDYRENNSLALSRSEPPDRRPLRIEVPPGRYTCMRFLLTGIRGETVMRGTFDYEDGTSREFECVSPQFYTDIRDSPILRGLWNVTAAYNGMDRIYDGRYQEQDDPALFEVILSVAPERTLGGLTIDPEKTSYGHELSIVHLFALTGVRRTSE